MLALSGWRRDSETLSDGLEWPGFDELGTPILVTRVQVLGLGVNI